MLRWLVLVLLLANAGYLAWSQHGLAGLGLAPATESEPERLRQQIEPAALRILPGQGSSVSSSARSITVRSRPAGRARHLPAIAAPAARSLRGTQGSRAGPCSASRGRTGW